MLIGGIEAGGTKIVCGAAEVTEEGIHILDRMRFATGRPEEAVRKAADYFKDFPIKALGVACFGPLDLRKDSATYGHIMATPKKGWEHFDLLGPFEKEIGVPAVLDTDVNGAALGEGAYGAGKGSPSSLTSPSGPASVSAFRSAASLSTASSIPKAATCLSSARLEIRMKAAAPSTGIPSCLPDASKGMPQGLPSKNDGARRGKPGKPQRSLGDGSVLSLAGRITDRASLLAGYHHPGRRRHAPGHPSSRWSGKGKGPDARLRPCTDPDGDLRLHRPARFGRRCRTCRCLPHGL